MRVTRLEIFGFKSFVERFTLNFDRNMIGIVGPNGCGKSNIVDALRWVLGETYAKQLRGTVLDDLIFNGSESRRPLGMAEVSVTIRPDEGWTDSVSTPSTAKPASRNGSAHSNGVAADEFLPVEALLADASVVVVCGETADAASDADSNGAVAAATEVTTSGSAAVPGEQSIEEQVMPPFLREVPGLLGASEIQFTRRLYRSGESEYFINKIPCRLRDMTDIYRLIGLGARGLSIVQQGEIGELISKKPVERRELLEEAAGIAGFRTRMEAATRKLEQTSDNMNRLRDIIAEVEKQVRILQRQAKRARERNELKANIRAVELELYSARLTKLLGQQQEYIALRDRLTSDVEQAKAALSIAEAAYEEAQAKVETLDVDLSDKRRELDNLQTVLQAARDQQRQLEVECARVDSRARSVQQNLDALEQRRKSVAADRDARAARLDDLAAAVMRAEDRRVEAERALATVQEREAVRLADAAERPTEQSDGPVDSALRAEIERLTAEVDRISEVTERVRTLEGAVRDRRRETDQSRDRLGKQRVKIAGVEAEIRTLESQLAAMADHVVKRTAGDNDAALDEMTAGGTVRSVLAAGLQVPEELQRALHAVLGERGSYLLSGNSTVLGERYAKRLERGAEKHAARIGVIDGRVAGGDAERGESSAVLDESELAAAPSARRLLEVLRVSSGFENATNALLGRYLIVDALAEGLRLNEHLRERGMPLHWIVTRDGEVITPWGWFTTEGKGGSFAFARRIEEQRALHASYVADLTTLEEELASLDSSMKELQQELSHAQQERDRLYSAQRELGALSQKERQLERERREAQAREERRRREEALAEERARQAELRRVLSEGADARSVLDQERRKVEDLTRDLEHSERQSEELRAELAALIDAQHELVNRLTEHTEGHRGSLERVQTDCELLAEGIQRVDAERSALRSEIHRLGQDVTRARRDLEGLQEQHMRATMQLERSQLERGMIFEERSKGYPDLAPEESFEAADADALLARAKGDLEAYLARLNEDAIKLRRRLEREGEVDPQSIELFEQEDARLADMQVQLADLEAAKEILERTIRQLKDVSKKRFLETFESVNEKFSALVPRLFGGGAGHLELINPEDPLTSGVQLVVRPPGKKVTNMELLSGGEKALVSTAVLVAMFLHRPSPICVLDEVDAPLDDANLERFLSLIVDISAKTQFLVITHNKQTMAAVDRLIGITMQEKGVTTALSVTLAEAEEALNASAA